ncbi:conjugal transfer protein TraB [Streptomyces bohaiensis]|uniref:conjugal transfer protein TraB n=1 Tax=Streptomyces bohaiensis TaxID=1431344 RepID=UPI003B7D18B8
MTDPQHLPEPPQGGDRTSHLARDDGNSFTQLASRVAALSLAALRLKEGMFSLQLHMRSNAAAADELADHLVEAEVEPRFIAQTQDVARAFRDVASGAGGMVSAADATATDAATFRANHQHEYGGIYEAVRASSVRQAKPGFYRTD